MSTMTKRFAAIAAAAAIATGGAGAAAWAAGWFDGSGSVTAQTATIQKVVASGSVDGALYPGKSTTFTATVDNKNDYPVSITKITSPVLLVDGQASQTCDLDSAKVSATLPSSPVKVAAKEKKTVDIPVTMGANASEACAGKNLTLTFNLEGAVAQS